MQTTIKSKSKTRLQLFVKLSDREKTSILINCALLLDSYDYKGQKTNLYFINGFFVEETINIETKKTVDVIPFLHGYRLASYINTDNKEIATEAAFRSLFFLN